MALARAQGGLRGSPLPWAPCGARAWALPPSLAGPIASRGLSRDHSEPGNGPAHHRSPTGLYELLQVPASTTQAQIKTAYYKQSFLYHPDRNAGSEEAAERFTRISEAYLVLGSVTLRKKYDQGILSQQDLRTAGEPSGKEGAPASLPTSARKSQTFTSSPSPAKPIFDFDKFFQAHYGKQLERERVIRQRRRELQKRRDESEKRWHLDALNEIGIAFLFFATLALFFSMRK
ncbi:dnaJ homolog subfamily C member 30, mitochondrial [Hemicordylus capensis]|uniref:dnaJ homolog subfamily C member 30, mitochondrial n=1 Tax=Hemicordylus capensis TaxID=884348 RepID=UPI0023032A55|nr:dnaJ homolog subfamily C member 30, mitochondrial [Hemicordylus capensis]